MKISVLIPALDSNPFIPAALESVRAQSHLDWELIVVEGGSHDNAAAVVEHFAATSPQMVRYENLDHHADAGSIRNRLIELARGDAVAWLEAHDTWEPTHLARAARALHEQGELVVSGVRMPDLAKQRLPGKSPAPADLLQQPVRALFERNAIVTSSAVVLTRDLVKRTGRFDPSLGHATDRDYWLRCALAGARFALTQEFTCRHGRHLASLTSRICQVAQHHARFYEKHRTLCVLPGRLRRRLLAESLVNLGRLLRPHDHSRSRACFWQAWRCAPLDPRIPLQLAVTRWHRLLPRAAG